MEKVTNKHTGMSDRTKINNLKNKQIKETEKWCVNRNFNHCKYKKDWEEKRNQTTIPIFVKNGKIHIERQSFITHVQ